MMFFSQMTLLIIGSDMGSIEGDGKDYDFLRREEWREQEFHTAEFRQALLGQLQ